MRTLLALIRNAGVPNIVVLPVGAMGQDEGPLLTMGAELVAEYPNVVFDIHAYQRWLKKPAAEVRARMYALRARGLAFLFGEVGPTNSGELMDPTDFLAEARSFGASVLAWIWKCRKDAADGNALLICSPQDAAGTSALNDEQNNNWGTTFTTFADTRRIDPPVTKQTLYRPRRVFMHYLPWFTLQGEPRRGGWCSGLGCDDNFTRRQYVEPGPLIGEYSQADHAVLEYHLLLADAANVDALVVNINPQNAGQLQLTEQLVEATRRLAAAYSWFRMRLVISYDDAQATTAAQVRANLQVLRDLFLHNNTARFFFFLDEATGRYPIFFWSDVATALHEEASTAIFGNGGSPPLLPGVLVLNRNARQFDSGHGNFEWIGFPVQPSDVPWGKVYLDDFEYIMAHQREFGGSAGQLSATLMSGGVWPGFDDSNAPASWNGGKVRFIPRHSASGFTLENTFKYALSRVPLQLGGDTAVDMPWLQVCTFNDWTEGTQVEPTWHVAGMDDTEAYAALQVVQRYARAFKNGETVAKAVTPEQQLALRLPAAVYRARMAGRSTEAAIALYGLGNITAAMDALVTPSVSATTDAPAPTIANNQISGAATASFGSSVGGFGMLYIVLAMAMAG